MKEFGQSVIDLVGGFESYLVERALRVNHGSVRESAMDLGITRQALVSMLEGRLKAVAHLAVRRPRGRSKADEIELIELAQRDANTGD